MFTTVYNHPRRHFKTAALTALPPLQVLASIASPLETSLTVTYECGTMLKIRYQDRYRISKPAHDVVLRQVSTCAPSRAKATPVVVCELEDSRETLGRAFLATGITLRLSGRRFEPSHLHHRDQWSRRELSAFGASPETETFGGWIGKQLDACGPSISV